VDQINILDHLYDPQNTLHLPIFNPEAYEQLRRTISINKMINIKVAIGIIFLKILFFSM